MGRRCALPAVLDGPGATVRRHCEHVQPASVALDDSVTRCRSARSGLRGGRPMAMELSRDPYISQVSSLPRDADEMQAREWEGRHRNGRLLRTGLVLDSRCSSIFLMDDQLGVSKVVVPVAAGALLGVIQPLPSDAGRRSSPRGALMPASRFRPQRSGAPPLTSDWRSGVFEDAATTRRTSRPGTWCSARRPCTSAPDTGR